VFHSEYGGFRDLYNPAVRYNQGRNRQLKAMGSLTKLAERSEQSPELRRSIGDQARSSENIHPILQLQRATGNRRVAELIQAKRLTPQGKILPLWQAPDSRGEHAVDATPAPSSELKSGAQELPRLKAASYPKGIQRQDADHDEQPASAETSRVAFVRKEGLSLFEKPDQSSKSLTVLKFGQRVHTLDYARPAKGWQKVAALGQTGYVEALKIHFPPEQLIQKDPGVSLIKVRPNQTFWGLVKETYGIEGDESTKDQNINHFINAIRAFNKPGAFHITQDFLDKAGNFFVSGRDAKDTLLIAGVDLWVPSFGVAAKMDVGSGTIRGEITRAVKKIEQKIDDFKKACELAVRYAPHSIKEHVGEVSLGLITGLIDFAGTAIKILAVSTAVGAMIGALFGGVGAIPGAEIGFEIGLVILEYYGLYTLIETVLQMAGSLVSRLAEFVGLVWNANGDDKQLDLAGQTLADGLGILVSAILAAVAAYLMKKGGEAIMKTKFAKTVGEKPLAKWLSERQKLSTTRQATEKLKTELPTRDKGRDGADSQEGNPLRSLSNEEFAKVASVARIAGSDHLIKLYRLADRIEIWICTRCGSLIERIDKTLARISDKGPTKSMYRRLTKMRATAATLEEDLNAGKVEFSRIPAETNQIAANMRDLATRFPGFDKELNVPNIVRPEPGDFEALAERLGFKPTAGRSHGQPVFQKGNKFISPDWDAHTGGAWKMADSVKNLGSKATRMGTYNAELERIGD
jgi:hypothetical protein